MPFLKNFCVQVLGRRHRKLVLPGLQFKIVLCTMAVAVPILALNFFLVYSDYTSLRYVADATPASIAARMSHSVISSFLISVCVCVPFCVAVGILYSFKFCGPICRFRRFLGDLRDGPWDVRCTLRRGDELVELKDAINDALALLAGRVKSQRDLMEKLRAMLASGEWSAEEAARLLAAEVDATRGRFGAGSPAPTPAGGAPEKTPEPELAHG